VQHGPRDVDAAELAGSGEAGEDGTAHVADPSDVHGGVRGDAILEHGTGLGSGPTLDIVELLDADRHAAERQRDISATSGLHGLFAWCVTERVELAGVDRVVRRLQLFGGGPFAGAEGIDQRTRVTEPCFCHGRTVVRP
jgi:hypothetical protein